MWYKIIETGLRLGVGTTACLTALEEMEVLWRSIEQVRRLNCKGDRQIIRGVVEYGCGQRAIAALAKAIGYDEGRTACRTMTLIQLGCLKAVGKTLGRLEELHNRLKGFDFFQRLGIPRDADPEHISRARADCLVNHQLNDETDDEVAIRKAKASVRRLLDEANNTLTDPMMLGIYKMALQSNRNFHDPEIRQGLVSEYALSSGKRLIDAVLQTEDSWEGNPGIWPRS